MGNSLDRLRAFPIDARRTAGFQLDRYNVASIRRVGTLLPRPAQASGNLESGGVRLSKPTSAIEGQASMSSKRFSFVWDAIEDSAFEAASLKLRALMANEVIERLRARKRKAASLQDLH